MGRPRGLRESCGLRGLGFLNYASNGSLSKRRLFLARLCASIAVALMPLRVATPISPTGREFRLRFYHTHTGKRLDIVYRQGNTYLPESLSRLDEYLADHRTGEVHHYDPRVFDLLHDLGDNLGHPEDEIEVICGYRSRESNEFLHAHDHGVAVHSLHMEGLAIDIRMPGVKTSDLRDAALALHRGGVGYYPNSDFVHVDIGRVRRW